MEKTSVSYVVRENGVVDVEKSVAAFRTALEELKQSQERELNQFRSAVETVLNASSSRVSLDNLVGMAMTQINPDLADYQKVANRLRAWVKANTGDEDGKLFDAQKGKGGGLALATNVEREETPESSESESSETDAE